MRPSSLPNLEKYVRRSESSGVPYKILESPPSEDAVHEIKSSSCLPRLESLLDTNFRKQKGKSARKSRPPKRILLVKSSSTGTACASVISPEVPECLTLTTKKGEGPVPEMYDKSTERTCSSSSSPLVSPLFDENAPLIKSIFEQVVKNLSNSSSSTLESTRRARSNEAMHGITTQGRPRIRIPIKSSSAEPPSTHASTYLEPGTLHGGNLSRSNPCSLSSTVDDEEASAARTSIFATAAALRRRKFAESAKASAGQGTAEYSIAFRISKKSRSASPGDVAPPAKKPSLSSVKHDGGPLPGTGEITDQTEKERTRKCRSASPVRALKRDGSLTVTLKDLLDSQISQINCSLERSRSGNAVKRTCTSSSKNEEAGDRETLNETQDPKSKKTKVDHNYHSKTDEKSPPSDLTFQESGSKFPTEFTETKSCTKLATSPLSDQKRGLSSRSSVGRPRALSAPSCTPEREGVDCDNERERASRQYREASPSRYWSLSPGYRHHESDHFYRNPHPVDIPAPPSQHHVRHHRQSLLGEPPYHHPAMTHLTTSPPYRGQPHYPLIVSPPPYYDSLSLPLPPPPHVLWSQPNASPYGPPPQFHLLDRNRNPYHWPPFY